MTSNSSPLLRPTSWQWPLFMYSTLVILHFSPTLALAFLHASNDITGALIVVPVCVYAGWRAREFVGMDAALASMAYIATSEIINGLRAHSPWEPADVLRGFVALAIAGLAGYTCALAGTVLHARRLRKAGVSV